MNFKQTVFTTVAVTGLAFLGLVFVTSTALAGAKFVTIGTGGIAGVYYPIGKAVCHLVNKNKKKHGVRCSVESTSGSVSNITSIREGDLDMGVVQSDWQYHAVNGTGRQSFVDAGPFKDLRAVFAVHAEPVSIVARKDSGITSVTDLVGKRVNIGKPGSGTEATWNVMWNALGKTNKDLKLVSQMSAVKTPDALCQNKIDAFFWLVGNPTALNQKATMDCNAVFADVSGPAIDQLVADNPFYRKTTIPGGMYRGNPNDVNTFGVGAIFVSSAKVNPDVIYAVVKSVFDNFATFKKMHPAFNYLTEQEMISAAISAPLHEGAVRYYKERGWM